SISGAAVSSSADLRRRASARRKFCDGGGSGGRLRNMWDLNASNVVEYALSSSLSGFVPINFRTQSWKSASCSNSVNFASSPARCFDRGAEGPPPPRDFPGDTSLADKPSADHKIRGAFPFPLRERASRDRESALRHRAARSA